MKTKLANTVQFSKGQLQNLDSNKKELSKVAAAYRANGTKIEKKA